MRTSKLDPAIESIYDEISRDDIYHHLQTSIDFIDLSEGNLTIRGVDSFNAGQIKRLEEFAIAVESTTGLGFEVFGRVAPARLSLATYFLTVMTCAYLDDRVHRFGEHVEAVLAAARQILAKRNPSGYDYKPSSLPFPSFEDCMAFNAIIELTRGKLCSAEFAARQRRRLEKARANYRSGAQYLLALFEKHSRLLIVRIDLGYRDGLCTPHLVPASLEQAHADLARLYNNLRHNELFDHLVGRISKLEYGASKGYHYHTFFIFNGNKRSAAEHIAQAIGEYWKNNITNGRGLAFNCNRRWAKRRGNGIGMVHRDEAIKRRYLLKALAYVTKADQHLGVRVPKGGSKNKPIIRCFIKGQIKPNESGVGRPRGSAAVATDRIRPFEPMPDGWIDESLVF